MAKEDPRWPQSSQRCGQDAPKMTKEGPKMAPKSHKMRPRCRPTWLRRTQEGLICLSCLKFAESSRYKCLSLCASCLLSSLAPSSCTSPCLFRWLLGSILELPRFFWRSGRRERGYRLLVLGPRTSQEEPGKARKSQEGPGRARKSQELGWAGRARKNQEPATRKDQDEQE